MTLNLDEIRKNLTSHLDDTPFNLNEKTVGTIEIIDFYRKTFQLSSLTVSNPAMPSGQDVTLNGTTSLLGVDGVDLSIVFYQSDDGIGINSVFSMPVSWVFKIPGIDRFSVGNFSFNLGMRGPSAEITGSMNGVIHLSDSSVDIPISIGLPISNYGWLLKGDFSDIKISGMSDMLGFIGIDNLGSVMPPGLKDIIKSLSIKDVEIFFSPSEARLYYISIVVELTDKSAGWDIITDKYSVSGLKLYIRVDHTSEGKYQVTLVISGIFNIFKDVKVPVVIQKTGGTTQWSLRIANSEGLPVPTLSDLAQLIGGYDLSQLLPETFTDLGKLTIYELGTGFDFAKSSLSFFSFKVGTAQPWSFFGIDQLKIKNVNLDFIINNPLDGQRRSVSGNITGIISLGGIDLAFSADNSSSGDGWLLTGGTATGQEINLTDLTGSLLEMFKITLPTDIPKVMIKYIQMSFNTKDKSWSLKAETSATKRTASGINLYDVDGIVNICCTKAGDKYTFTGYVEGDLAIGQSVFTLRFDMGKDTNIFNGSWKLKSATDIPLGIADIAGVLGLSFTPPPQELDLSLVKASFSYYTADRKFVLSAKSKNYGTAFFVTTKDSSGKQGFVFGLDYRGDLCLSDFPVVGKDLHFLDSINLRQIRVLLSTTDYQDFIIPDLPPMDRGDVTDVFELPAKTSVLTGDPSSQKLQINKGISLSGVIDFIDEVTPFNLQIVGDSEKVEANVAGSDAPKAFWISIQKAFGPIHFKRLGLAYGDKNILLILDASFISTALNIGLDGLTLGFPLADPLSVAFCLHGMAIDFNSGPVEISGGFLGSDTKPVSYSGEALIKSRAFSISGIGSYATVDGNPSLFIYAMLSMPLGGPPYFFVNGLATGFGYNRKLIIPPLEKLTEFPLVSLALGNCDKEKMLQEINKCMSVAVGEDWLAAGIKFNSFKMIDSFALLTVSFGTRFEVDLLGLSEINIPVNVSGSKDSANPIAHAQLALKVVFAPDDGLMAASAALTSESYILSRDCKLVGGFAFYLWFAKEHAGDFVITLGGYHPAFKKPDHYPPANRLGFNWKVDNNLTLKGGAYFALTPSCIMAGGELDATYLNGNLKAWFRAYADFLIQWKPFHYDISIGANIGASYRVDFLFIHHTFTIELSASLHIWGPEFAGKAHISWYIISFTISFGSSDSAEPLPLSWSEFSSSFLPQEKNSLQKLTANDGQDSPLSIVCTVSIQDGLLKEFDGSDGQKKWLVKSDNFTFTTGSVVPCTAITFNNTALSLGDRTTNLAILPMGAGVKLDSSHIVFIEKQLDNGTWQQIPEEYIASSVITGNVPASLWGLSKTKTPSADTISNVPTGLKLAPSPAEYYQLPVSGSLELKTFKDEPIGLEFSWGNTLPPERQPYPQNKAIDIFMNSIMDKDKVIPCRKNILDVLKTHGICDTSDVSLDKTASTANNLLVAPILINLGAVLS